MNWRLGDGVRLDGTSLVDDRLDKRWNLNSTSLFIVSRLVRGQPVADIVPAYAAEFGASPAEAEQDIQALLAVLSQKQLLTGARRDTALSRQEDLQRVLQHPIATLITRSLLASFSWYYRLISTVLGNKPEQT